MTQQLKSEEVSLEKNAFSLWGLPLQPCGCAQCHAAYLIPEDMIGSLCPICSQVKLESQSILSRQEPPERYLAFEKSKDEIKAIVDRYVKEVWLPPDDFNTTSIIQRAKAVYWPMWLVDCDVSGSWEADMGYDYQVQSSIETLQGVTWKTQALVETRTNWENRCGAIARHYDNILSIALEDHVKISNFVGDYNREKSQIYRAEALINCTIIVPDIHPENAWPLAEGNLKRAASNDCARAAGAQHHRSFTWKAEFSNPHWTQILLPLFTSYYTDDDGVRHTVLINGQTGKIGGLRMASQKKGVRKAVWAACIAALLFLIGLLFIALTPLAPPLSALAVLLILCGFGSVGFALILALWPLRWNKRQSEAKSD